MESSLPLRMQEADAPPRQRIRGPRPTSPIAPEPIASEPTDPTQDPNLPPKFDGRSQLEKRQAAEKPRRAILGTLAAALTGKARAAAALAKSEETEREAWRAQRAWESLKEELAQLRWQISQGRGLCDGIQAKAEEARVALVQNLGHVDSNVPIAYAENISTAERLLPIMRKAVAEVCAKTRSHLAQMLAFAEEHQVPKEAIAELPTAEQFNP